ncbi:RING finger domain-containingprotein [Paramyrothecium foliicola]|nr:RING finger domain-containingprotein [Paramyrothecium foliicola]
MVRRRVILAGQRERLLHWTNRRSFAMSTRNVLRRTILLPVALAFAAIVAADNEAFVTPLSEQPPWAAENAMQLNLSIAQEWLPQQYTVVPLTNSLGANMSSSARGVISVNGELKAAEPSDYNTINDPNDIAFLSCDNNSGDEVGGEDSSNDSFIGSNKMLNDLMRAKPKAIILYSVRSVWCNLDSDGPLEYSSLFSMADPSESIQVLGYLNETDKSVKASITGSTALSPDDSHHGPNKSSVAMSILYTITGLVTLLFVVIIGTGAVKAHRYPERYGPRGAAGGRPRQSRAKGIARAVLETIPIVKFGNQQPSKPDPELELETATTDGQDMGAHRTVSNASKEMSGAAANSGSAAATPRHSQAPDRPSDVGGAHLGCTICTEDFEVGEDVRVLPCGHHFHPHCIDPWLINVSGTCPLCRFDLRHGNPGRPSTADDTSSLPPPLAWETEDGEGDAIPAPQRNRLSRLFDINWLRQASREEQMETLRRIVAERREHSSQETETDGEERRQGVRLADKLKEKFRIRTRAQSLPRDRS